MSLTTPDICCSVYVHILTYSLIHLYYSIVKIEHQEVIDQKPWPGNCIKIACSNLFVHYTAIFSDELPLKTDLPDDIASKEKVHERYKQLTQVESAFREMKGDILNIRPLYLRKAERTKGHVVVVMLGYMILHKLNKLWSPVKETIEESLDALTNLCILKVESNENSILKLPTPNEECKNLLNLAKIKWPKFIIGGAIV